MNKSVRNLFPICENYVYLNSAAVAPPPLSAVQAIKNQLEDVQLHGSTNFREWVAVKEDCRKLFAALINAKSPENIAFLRNTSDALSSVANGLDWKKGENIVSFANEFPSNIYPWRNMRDTFGVELRLCPERKGGFSTDEFISLIDEKTKIVAVSGVQYASGFRADLSEIGKAAREKSDALFVVDTIQMLGNVPLDVDSEQIDVIAGACHKWLCTPEGIGYIYLNDNALRKIKKTLVGWISVSSPQDFGNHEQPFAEGARAWETGTSTASHFFGLRENLRLFLDLGMENVRKHLLDLSDFLCAELEKKEHYEIISPRGKREKSAIVCLQHRDLSAEQIFEKLAAENIVVSPRGERLRVAPHIFNNRRDIERFLDALP